MQWLYSVLCLYTFLSSISAAPTQFNNRRGKIQGRSFKVDQVQRSTSSPDGLAAIKRAYARYGITPPDTNFGVSEAADVRLDVGNIDAAVSTGDADENGAVKNEPQQNDVQYLSPVTIGGQKFVMNFDTGSADTWVANSLLSSKAVNGHSIFNPSISKTFKELEGSVFDIEYGDKSFARGKVGVDTVDIGGTTVDKQAFGMPNQVAGSFSSDGASDGIIGLAFSNINTIRPKPQPTFFENVAADLEQPVFTAQLKLGQSGMYEFGKIDQSKFKGPLVNVSVDSSGGFWEFKSGVYKIGDDGPLQHINDGSKTAIADTGTSLMLVNNEVAEAYYAQVKGAKNSPESGGYTYPCNAALPTFQVSLGDEYFAKIPGSVITYGPSGRDSTGQDLCFGGIQPNQNSNVQVFGDVFFKAIFTVFDLRGPSLGFAAHC